MNATGANRTGKAGFRTLVYGLALALIGAAVGVVFAPSPDPHRRRSSDVDRHNEIRSYVIGYGLALALTAAAFACVRWQDFGSTATLAIVLILALVQAVVHFRFFLHIDFSKSARDDLQLILFATLILILMVSGTLVILFNLRERMM